MSTNLPEPTEREILAAFLMDFKYGAPDNAWRPDPHIDMVRLQPGYFLCAPALEQADAILAAGYHR